jgi:hypothetical protein
MESELSLKEQFARYILGALSEEERLKLEERYFADPDLLRELQAASDDLADAYLRGEMSDARREQFERCLRSQPYLRDRLTTDRALLAYVDRAALARGTAATGGFFAKLWAGLKQPQFRPRMIALSLVALLFAGGIWYAVISERATPQIGKTVPPTTPSTHQGDQAAPQSSATPAAGAPRTIQTQTPRVSVKITPSIATFFLSVDVVRGTDDSPRLTIPPQTDLVELQLEVTDSDYQHFRVELQTRSGATLQTSDNLPLKIQHGAPTVSVRLPARLLTPTNYLLKLSAPDADQEVKILHQYYFSIE